MKKKSITFYVFCVFCCLLAGCTKENKKMKHVLKLNFEAEPFSFDPRVGTNVLSQSALRMLFEGLMKINK